MADSPKFAHRSNLDGTADSICFRCIATVATAMMRANSSDTNSSIFATQFSRAIRRYEAAVL